MFICPGCRKRKYWFQKWGGNSSWHKRCFISWEAGYKTRIDFESDMIRRIDTLSAHEIYLLTNPYNNIEIYELIRQDILNAHNIENGKEFVVKF